MKLLLREEQQFYLVRIRNNADLFQIASRHSLNYQGERKIVFAAGVIFGKLKGISNTFAETPINCVESKKYEVLRRTPPEAIFLVKFRRCTRYSTTGPAGAAAATSGSQLALSHLFR